MPKPNKILLTISANRNDFQVNTYVADTDTDPLYLLEWKFDRPENVSRGFSMVAVIDRKSQSHDVGYASYLAEEQSSIVGAFMDTPIFLEFVGESFNIDPTRSHGKRVGVDYWGGIDRFIQVSHDANELAQVPPFV